MRILGIKQPWSTLIVAGFKTVENRVWSTPYRGIVLVHATRKADRAGIEALLRCMPTTRIEHLPYGQIIGVVEIYDVRASGNTLSAADREWFGGPFGFLLRNAHQFDRGVPISGQLGLWSCPPDIERKVRPILNALGIRPGEQFGRKVEHEKPDRRTTRRKY